MCGVSGEAAEPVAEVGDDVADAVGDGDEEDADDREADREQAQAEDDELLCCLSPHPARTLTGRTPRIGRRDRARAGTSRRQAGPPGPLRGGGRDDGRRAFGDPRARRPDRRARSRRRAADLARGRAGERAAGRRAAPEPAARCRAGVRRPTRSTAPSASPRRRPRPRWPTARADGRSRPTRRCAPASSSRGRVRRGLGRGRGRRRAERLPLARRATDDGAGDRGRAASVAPVAVKDIFCTEGVPTTAGSRILEGYRPPYTATAVRRLIEAGAPILGKTNMDEFAMGSSNENSAYGPVLNPWDREPRSRRLLRRLGGGGRRRPGALGDRHRHRRLDPPAGGALRDRRPQAHLRRDLALRDDRLRLLARPVRPADPRRQRRRPAAGDPAGRAIPATRPRSGSSEAPRAARPRGPQGAALRGAGGAGPRRDRAGRARGLRGDAGDDRASSAARSPRWRCRTPSTASPPTT